MRSILFDVLFQVFTLDVLETDQEFLLNDIQQLRVLLEGLKNIGQVAPHICRVLPQNMHDDRDPDDCLGLQSLSAHQDDHVDVEPAHVCVLVQDVADIVLAKSVGLAKTAFA